MRWPTPRTCGRTAAGCEPILDATSGEVLLQYNDLHTQSAVGTGIGVLGDTKKISTRLQSGRYLADDALRPPVLITYDMQGNLSRTERYLDGFYIATSVRHRQRLATTAGPTRPRSTRTSISATPTTTTSSASAGRGSTTATPRSMRITHPVRRSDFRYAVRRRHRDLHAQRLLVQRLRPGVPRRDDLRRRAAGRTSSSAARRSTTSSGATRHRRPRADPRPDRVTPRTSFTATSPARSTSRSPTSSAPASSSSTRHPGPALRQADYLIGEDIVPARRDALDGEPGGVRRSRSLLAALHGQRGQRRRAHQFRASRIRRSTWRSKAARTGPPASSVSGVGGANREQIEKAFYRAFAFMLPSNATFATARAATIQAARDLYGAGSPAERAITQAWTAVGVN